MLVVEDLEVRYQELRALQGVSLRVAEGDLVALIGSNGAGKTTMLNAISGLIPAASGRISWRGNSLVGLSPDRVCMAGVVQVPEGRKLFPKMTVEENLEMGAYLPAARKHLAESRKAVFEIFPLLAEREKQLAGSLSGGEQQMVALARAIMAKPGLLLLDEPSLGLAPVIAAEIFQVIEELNRKGITALLISQEVLHSLNIAKYGYVLENGKITIHGKAGQLLDDQRIKESYLGL
ncbi:MAG: ABC transporter ATP-binding protein [Deltaproteobacteria bacterium]|nr:ABC transporter ATP-binding protein [Deltaproteobacteria bacterium]MBW1921296.1 ABC transporter ATP-binding protein [Deltaproteobacteria bacterium]MBW1934664.1 ABC transporter ATP-binding protein [Deltaproteobacteria bacterium]